MESYDVRRMRRGLALSFFLFAFLALCRALSPVWPLAESVFGAAAFWLTALIGGVWAASAWCVLSDRPRVVRALDWFEYEAGIPLMILLSVPLMIGTLIGCVAALAAVLAPLCAPPPAAEYGVAAVSAWFGAIQLRKNRLEAAC